MSEAGDTTPDDTRAETWEETKPGKEEADR